MADTLETAQHFIFVTQVYFCAMYAVVIWDWIVSFGREWRFIWKTRWTPVKAAYLFCRYWVIAVVPFLLFCFVGNHSLDTCQRLFKVPVAFAMWNQAGAEVVLLIRTYAFFNRNVYILTGLICAMGGMIAYQLFVTLSEMDLLPFVTPPFLQGPCYPVSKPHSAHLLGFFIAPLLFDTIVTTMTVVKAVLMRRRNGSPNSRLIQTFLREGVFYYILISIANLINGIFYLQPRQVISAINIPLSVMLGPVLACRLILDLRERGSETVSLSEGTGIGYGSKSNIVTGLNGSPFVSNNGHRHHRPSRWGGKNSLHGHGSHPSNILTTYGSVLPELEEGLEDIDAVEVELDAMGFARGPSSQMMHADADNSLTRDTSIIEGSPAPAYEFSHNVVPSRTTAGVTHQNLTEITSSGIVIEVETATSTNI